MPTYRSRSNTPQTVYYDQTFLPGKDVISKRYINLERYDFLTKISDEPFVQDILVHDAVNAAAISRLYDFYRSITLRLSDDGASDGNTVNVAVLAGDTDNINDFMILGESTFTKTLIGTGISSWGSDSGLTIDNIKLNAYKFFYVAITSITLQSGATVNLYIKSIKQ